MGFCGFPPLRRVAVSRTGLTSRRKDGARCSAALRAFKSGFAEAPWDGMPRNQDLSPGAPGLLPLENWDTAKVWNPALIRICVSWGFSVGTSSTLRVGRSVGRKSRPEPHPHWTARSVVVNDLAAVEVWIRLSLGVQRSYTEDAQETACEYSHSNAIRQHVCSKFWLSRRKSALDKADRAGDR